MRKLTYAFAAAAALALMAGSAQAASSKFAATYDTDPVMVSAEITGIGGAACDPANCLPRLVAEVDLAKIHVATWKEILVGVSAQIQLVTFTQAKGKNGGGEATAIASGGVQVDVMYAPEGTDDPCIYGHQLYPGTVTLASRAQELSVNVSLDVVGAIPEVCDEDCIAENLDIEGDVTVALGLDTTAAHHFNFIADDMTSGYYEVVACYDLTALAEVAGLDIDADTAAMTKVVLGPRIVVVQEVRATKDGIINESGVD